MSIASRTQRGPTAFACAASTRDRRSAQTSTVSLKYGAGPIALHEQHPPQATAAAAAGLTDAEVRKVDREGGKLTLRHGEIKDLAMPPMTMVFKVREIALLESLAPDDRVRFKAILDGGTLTAIDIQVAQ